MVWLLLFYTSVSRDPHTCTCFHGPCRSPEQFAPGSRTSNKVDIWGFAATLLHMITGSPPWQHDTLMQICTAVGVAKQAPPLPEGLPPPLQALMSSCFEADPAKRPTAVYLLKVRAQRGTACCSMVQHGTAWQSMAQHTTACHSMAWLRCSILLHPCFMRKTNPHACSLALCLLTSAVSPRSLHSNAVRCNCLSLTGLCVFPSGIAPVLLCCSITFTALQALQALGPALQQHLLAGAVSSAAPLQQQQHVQQQGHPPAAARNAAAKAPAAAVQDEQVGLTA